MKCFVENQFEKVDLKGGWRAEETECYNAALPDRETVIYGQVLLYCSWLFEEGRGGKESWFYESFWRKKRII